MKLFKAISKYIKKLRDPFYWVGRTLKYNANSIWNAYYYKRTIRRCMRAWKLTGIQHHVIPVDGDKVTIINNRWLNMYNKQPGNKKININDLLKMAYYSTPIGKRIIKTK